MNAAVPDEVVVLLQESLAAWCVPGVISRKPDGSLELRAGGTLIGIARAPAGVPFRWLVGVGELRRPVGGLPGLLRSVRAALDPNFRRVAVRIAALPVAP
jgi:hypothetical protein